MSDIIKDKAKIESMLNETTASELLRRMTELLRLVNSIDNTYTEKNPAYLEYLRNYNHADKSFIYNFADGINKLSSLREFSIASVIKETRKITPKNN